MEDSTQANKHHSGHSRHHHHHHSHSGGDYHTHDDMHEFRKQSLGRIERRKRLARWTYRIALIITILCILMVAVVYTIL